MEPAINIKEFFSLLSVEKLRELAYKHNLMSNIKSPSRMLKAELIQSLSEHYMNLNGTDLLAIYPKPLQLNRLDIPPKYQDRKPKVIKKLEQPVGKKQQEFRILQQQRVKRNAKFISDEKLQDAVMRREERQEREKKKRQLKQKMATEKGREELKPVNRILKQYNNLLDYSKKVEDTETDEQFNKLFRKLKEDYGLTNLRYNAESKLGYINAEDKLKINMVKDKVEQFINNYE